MKTHTCPGCLDGQMSIFYSQDSVPSNSCILLSSPKEAIAYPRGRMDMGFCDSCGFISNLSFDPRLTEYSQRYEETQAFSGTFNAFHIALVERLIRDYRLTGKRVLEIGCGKGEFLKLICQKGNNSGIGFDPGFRPERIGSDSSPDITFVQDFYSDKYAHEKADFVCSKMTLEHISQTGDFVAGVRRAIGEYRCDVFFQIPEATRILADCAFEDIYYEHCSYFTPGSLARLFRSKGFTVTKLSTEYDGQYLTIEARPRAAGDESPPLDQEDDLATLRRYTADFSSRVRKKLEQWRSVLDRAATNGDKVALWGSGSKAVSFLTTLELTSEIEQIVDINPHRWGHYMAGTGHPIVSPAELTESRPDLVIAMNPIYKREITRDLSSIGLSPTVLTL
ncbi:class I SAM-dependent methyltransferase [Parahaliea mediterranea]|uniref:Methyltransferase domain-containing protein n=1 Tax=Parahaliea mediterranea TaxID=651086 RepID=A0A939IHC4_9GAMM|nr:class I SAM-dependent methyltransferase [Parahaliea mediterranea]MBN7795254.1 methyltransferase domain-containing protein [Parahaliea mediterranea]